MTGTLSGPMFEPAKHGYWESTHDKRGAHYNTYALAREGRVADESGMAALRELFPEGEANELNFCLFSTSGVHGTYTTIEEAEEEMRNPPALEEGEKRYPPSVTFLVIHPRIVCTRHGNCHPENAEDIAFLKKLRESSWRAVQGIGRCEPPTTRKSQP